MPATRRERRGGDSARSRLGAAAEQAVVDYLTDRDIHILERNLRLGSLEIDVVALHGRVVVVVEVRSRAVDAWTTGFGSIDGKKRMLIRRAGERLWNRRFKLDERFDRMRFDAASVTADGTGWHVDYAIAAF